MPDQAGRQAIHDAQDRAHDIALEKSRQQAVAEAPKRTGEFAAHIQSARFGQQGGLFNDLPQAGAVERGANVGPRRGPHMKGSHVIARAGEAWGDHFLEALRSGG